MAYQPNIPLGTDQLSKSQVDINNNFGAIQTLIDVNHVDFANTSDQGKHNLSQYVTLGSIPTLGATEMAIYNNVSTLTGLNELFVQRGSTAQEIEFTASSQTTGGWTYLPSGVKLAWAIVNAIPGAFNFSLNTANLGASFPGFTNAFVALTTMGTIASFNPPAVIWVTSLSNTVVQVTTNLVAGSVPCYLLVIGN